MIALGIILFVAGLAILIYYIIISKDDYSPLLIFIVLAISGGITILAAELNEQDTAVKCLKGHNPYKMVIKYELKDSVYIPIDTVYTKIK